MDARTYRFTWQGIEIEAVYTPLRYDDSDHLEIRSVQPPRAPLPITETGYLSQFFEAGEIEANNGSLVEQVLAWLDEEAAKPEWKRHVEESRQGCLF